MRDTLSTIRNCESRMNDCQVKIDKTNAILAEKEQRVEVRGISGIVRSTNFIYKRL